MPSTMARPGDVKDVEILFLDDAVQVRVDEIQSGRGSKVSQEPRLDVLNR